MMRKCHESAPGPDGLGYTCWKRAPPFIRAVLYACDRYWLTQGGVLPHDFTWAFLAVLPKCDEQGDDACVSRDASSLRPLSLSKCDGDVCLRRR